MRDTNNMYLGEMLGVVIVNERANSKHSMQTSHIHQGAFLSFPDFLFTDYYANGRDHIFVTQSPTNWFPPYDNVSVSPYLRYGKSPLSMRLSVAMSIF